MRWRRGGKGRAGPSWRDCEAFEWKRHGGGCGDAEGRPLEGSVDQRRGGSVEQGRGQSVRPSENGFCGYPSKHEEICGRLRIVRDSACRRSRHIFAVFT